MLCGTAAHEAECMRFSERRGTSDTLQAHLEHVSHTVAVSPCHMICVRCGAAPTP